jgi:hypothetical protein
MTRDKVMFGRAARLLARIQRRFDTGRCSQLQYHERRRRIVAAHYNAQRAAGSTDYQRPTVGFVDS